MKSGLKPREAKKGQGGRSLPRPVGETGRRSAGKRKERRLRRGYASFPDRNPLQGQGVEPLVGFGAKPHCPHREVIKEKSSQGAKRYLTVNARIPGERSAFHHKTRETTLTFFPLSDTIISVSARVFARRQRR